MYRVHGIPVSIMADMNDGRPPQGINRLTASTD